jgi:hypothetical protein
MMITGSCTFELLATAAGAHCFASDVGSLRKGRRETAFFIMRS